MGQRHVTRIASLIVTNVVFVVFVVGFVFAATGLPDAESILAREHDRTASRVVDLAAGGSISDAKLSGVAAEAPDLLIVKEQGETVYSRYTNEFYFRWFGTGDYRYVDAGRYGLFFDMRTLNVLESKTNILVLVMIIFLVLALLVVYSPHFALTVTDPLHIMRKGLEDPSYNHEVDIPGKYRDDDIYRLAFLYNSVYLPLKDRNRDEAVAKCSLLDFDDMKDLLGDEV